MTWKEAIARIKDHMEHHGIGEYPHVKLAEALNMALTALRPVSREQVEKVWKGEWRDLHGDKLIGIDDWGKTFIGIIITAFAKNAEKELRQNQTFARTVVMQRRTRPCRW